MDVEPALAARTPLEMLHDVRDEGALAVDPGVRERAVEHRPCRPDEWMARQILAIARTLIGGPKVLLLDEPTEGIQPSIVDEILSQLIGINTRLGVTMILVEQNLDFAREFAHRAYTMLKGQITEELGPDGLSDPRVIAEYLGV